MTDPIVAVADQLNDPANGQNLQYAQLRQGVVTAISPTDNSLTMFLSGDTTTPVIGIKCLNTFQPTVGDTVWCLKSGSDIIGIGKVATGTQTAFGQAQNFVTSNNVITAGAAGFFTLVSSPNSVTLTKRFSTSNLFVNLSVTGYGDVASGGILEVAINIGGTDYIVAAATIVSYSNTLPTAWLSGRVTAAGSTVIPSLPAGSITALIRIRNVSTVGNLHVDTGDFYSLTVQEVL